MSSRVAIILGPNSFSKDMAIKVDDALSNFYISQKSQSDTYRDSIVSLSALVAEHGNNAISLRKETELTLRGYFERKFEFVDSLVVTVEEAGSSIDLRISAILRDGTQSFDMAHAVTLENSVIKKIIDLQNDGKPIINADMFG